MAFMIPSTLAHQPDTTAGERKLFDLFKKTLPDSCVVRYEVLLGERYYRPDYVLVDPCRGVLLIEVKDWGVDTILKANRKQFCVVYGGKFRETKRNPDEKCQIYMRHIRENLAAMPILRGDVGELHVPLYYFVAFPNISKKEFADRGLDQVISPDHVLLRADLVKTGQPFLVKYNQVLPELKDPLSEEQATAVEQALFPDTVLPSINPGFIREKNESVVEIDTPIFKTYQLSLEQEQIAKSLGEGPRLLRGIAGTGKTLIMLYRAKLLAANYKDRRILILCWNVSLDNYMHQAYEKLDIQAEGQVDIGHFSRFMSDLFKQKGRSCSNLDAPDFITRLNSLVIEDSDMYDAIYIDEAQDFRAEWITFLYKKMLKGEPKERNLLIAADDAQRIYHKRDFSWKSLGIPMIGRTKILKKVYRNSARVWTFSAFLLKEKASYVRENSERVQFSSKGGYDPLLVECSSLKAQVDKVVDIIKSMIKDGYAARNVLVLYKGRSVGRFQLVRYLLKIFRENDIPSDWISEDKGSKDSFDWSADTVKISTVHSAKGMDSPVVIVLGAEMFQQDVMNECDETKLMYVALTRAREFLVVLYTGDEGLVPQLKHCQAEYNKFRPAIVGLEKEKAV